MSDKDQEKHLEKFVTDEEKKAEPIVGSGLVDTSTVNKPWEKDEISLGNKIGWVPLPIKDLPTTGLFYPDNAEIAIKPALTTEIRHWSTLEETNYSNLDSMLNYILERCATYKTSGPYSSWKDICEVDRFYILLAIREISFVTGENQLQVKISETKKIDVTKDMVDFINFGDELMKYYDSTKKCFNLKFKSGKAIEVFIPTVGVTQFLKNYFNRKQALEESIDADYMPYAPFLIKDWRGLSDSSYENYVLESNSWSKEEISVLSYVKDLFAETINPVIRYIDDGGAEKFSPVNFQGGIKSLFLISNPLGQLV